MSLQNILKVEVFYCWGIDFVGPLPSSHSNFGPVEYVSKHVEVVATKKNDDKTVIMFLNKNICSHFGVPRGLINDGGSHFCNAQLQKVLGITMLDIKWILPTTHKPMVKSRCQVRNLRRSLRRQLLLQERIELQNLIMPYGLIGLPSRPQLVHLPAKFGI